MRRLYIINGLPGSGKGTQAEMVADKFGIVHISSGQLIRDALKSDKETTFLKQIRQRYNAGEVQPDEVALQLIEDKISSLATDSGVVFDSFPINLSQAILLEDLIKKYNFSKPIFIMLNISAEEALKRLSTRKICLSCGTPYIDKDNSLKRCQKCGGKLVTRTDDKESVVQKRINSYLPLLGELSAYYQSSGQLFLINSEQGIDQVFADIVKALNEK